MYPTFRRKNRILGTLGMAIHTFVFFNLKPSILTDSFQSLRKKSITGMECLDCVTHQYLTLNDCPSKTFGGSYSQARIQFSFKHPFRPLLAQQSPSAKDYPVSAIFCVSPVRLLFNSAFKLLQMNRTDIQC